MQGIDWKTGYIGTAEWVADQRAARMEREAQREACIPATAARADAAAGFTAMAAPGCIDEAVKRRGFSGYSGDSHTVPPIGVRRATKAVQRAAVARLQRRAIMRQARQNELERRASLTPLVTSDDTTPLVRLAQDVAAGTFPRPTATVSERVYIVKGDEQTIVTRRRPTQTRNYRRTVIEAKGYMLALERLMRDYKDERTEAIACMQAAPSNDGRAALAHRAPDAVNGTKVRGMPLWYGTPAASVRGSNGRLLDRTCYRVMPNGRRVPLVTPAVERKRKVAAATIVAQRLTAASLPRVVAD